MENEPHLTWHRQMHNLLQKMIHTAKRNKSGIPKEKIESFTEKYDSGLAETGAVVIALFNVIFAYHADKRLSKSNPPIKPNYNAVNPPQTENNNYCPGCGAYIASETNKGASFCPYCGKDLSTKTESIYNQFEK